MPESGRGVPQSFNAGLALRPEDLSVCDFSSHISRNTPVMTPPVRGGVFLSTKVRADLPAVPAEGLIVYTTR